MRTNITLDDELVKEAFKYSLAKTKKELIHEALREYEGNRQTASIHSSTRNLCRGSGQKIAEVVKLSFY